MFFTLDKIFRIPAPSDVHKIHLSRINYTHCNLIILLSALNLSIPHTRIIELRPCELCIYVPTLNGASLTVIVSNVNHGWFPLSNCSST